MLASPCRESPYRLVVVQATTDKVLLDCAVNVELLAVPGDAHGGVGGVEVGGARHDHLIALDHGVAACTEFFVGAQRPDFGGHGLLHMVDDVVAEVILTDDDRRFEGHLVVEDHCALFR